MDEQDRQRAAMRLRVAIDLHESGVRMKRAQLRRLFPEKSEAALGQEVAAWLGHRPGADGGDVEVASMAARGVLR